MGGYYLIGLASLILKALLSPLLTSHLPFPSLRGALLEA